MATIAKVKRAKGFAYQAKIKRRGRILKTQTFKTKTAAREWARRYEAGVELDLALGDPGRRTRFDDLCAQYLDEYEGRTPRNSLKYIYLSIGSTMSHWVAGWKKVHSVGKVRFR